MKTPAAVLLCLVFPLCAACTQPQRDASSREWARSECNRVIDAADRERCLKRAEEAYGPTGERREPAVRY
jgi:hypothetical protein